MNSAGDRQGKFFVQDLGEPGLPPGRLKDEPFDLVYESVTKRMASDGDWKAQRMSKER